MRRAREAQLQSMGSAASGSRRGQGGRDGGWHVASIAAPLHARPTFWYRTGMVKPKSRRARHARSSDEFDAVLRFTVTLEETEPPIWRRIEIPDTSDFWA